jgi:hypothetical protein
MADSRAPVASCTLILFHLLDPSLPIVVINEDLDLLSVVSHSLPYNCILNLDSSAPVEQLVTLDTEGSSSIPLSPLYGGIRSPVTELPPTPPASHPSTPGTSSSNKPPQKTARWTLTPRRTHSALTSGIRSLSATHEVTIVAWPGDLVSRSTGERIGNDAVSLEHKKALEEGMSRRMEDGLQCVPVWLSDKVTFPFFLGGSGSPAAHYADVGEFVDVAEVLRGVLQRVMPDDCLGMLLN